MVDPFSSDDVTACVQTCWRNRNDLSVQQLLNLNFHLNTNLQHAINRVMEFAGIKFSNFSAMARYW